MTQRVFEGRVLVGEGLEDRPCRHASLATDKKRPARLANRTFTLGQYAAGWVLCFERDKKRTVFDVGSRRLNRRRHDIRIGTQFFNRDRHRAAAVLETTIGSRQEVRDGLVVDNDSTGMFNAHSKTECRIELFQARVAHRISQSATEQSDDAALGRFGRRIANVPARACAPTLQRSFEAQEKNWITHFGRLPSVVRTVRRVSERFRLLQP